LGSNSELRAVAEVYASRGGRRKLAVDFARAWTKVMDLDRFDLRRPKPAAAASKPPPREAIKA
jgi:catalase-peroxidase